MSHSNNSMELTGATTPPMANGEVVFEAPWQSRAFGMARVMCEAGHYTWDEFRERLIARIEEWESAHITGGSEGEQAYPYFDCFLAALTDVLDRTGLCDAQVLAHKESEFAARPHGHDH